MVRYHGDVKVFKFSLAIMTSIMENWKVVILFVYIFCNGNGPHVVESGECFAFLKCLSFGRVSDIFGRVIFFPDESSTA